MASAHLWVLALCIQAYGSGLPLRSSKIASQIPSFRFPRMAGGNKRQNIRDFGQRIERFVSGRCGGVPSGTAAAASPAMPMSNGAEEGGSYHTLHAS